MPGTSITGSALHSTQYTQYYAVLLSLTPLWCVLTLSEHSLLSPRTAQLLSSTTTNTLSGSGYLMAGSALTLFKKFLINVVFK